jgi:hypothetical protein
MAVLNPPRSLPGLVRSIINHLLDSRAKYDEDRLQRLFVPDGLNDDLGRLDGIKNTLAAMRALTMIASDSEGHLSPSTSVLDASEGEPFTRDAFRTVLREHVLDLARDGDPWQLDDEAARTAGARDLTRALSWFLAQDALGAPLSWTGQGASNAQELQAGQMPGWSNDDLPLSNDTRWAAFSRWAPALGFAEAASAGSIQGLVPLPIRAVRDVICSFEGDEWMISDFLAHIGSRLPVLAGGPLRRSLTNLLDADPDPSVNDNAVDSSVAQSLLILDDEGTIRLTYESDAESRTLSSDQSQRFTHVHVLGRKR